MTENKVSGKKYRILTDAVNDIWDRISFWTKASDVEYNDGSNGEALKTRVGDLENELTANNKRIYLDYKNGKYGYNTSSSRGSSTFYPFREPHTTTYAYKDTDSITVDMGAEHVYRFVDGTKLFEKAYLKGWNHDTDGIKFVHHVHSTANTTTTVEDNNPTTTGNYGAATSSTGGGCYTDYHAATSSTTTGECGGTSHWNLKGDHWEFECDSCHYVSDTAGIPANGSYDYPAGHSASETASCSRTVEKTNNTPAYYGCTCGHPTGEIVSIRITS